MKQTRVLLLILVFTLLSTLSYAQEYTPDSNTVALWHFNEGSGSLAIDETGRFNGAINGATWVSGKYGNALSFNGVTNSVTISSNLSEGITNQMTAEAWIYPTKYGRIIGRYSSGLLSYLFTFEGNRLALYINSPSSVNAARSSGTILLNTWTHVAATYDGSNVKFYINGNLDSTKSLNLGNIRENSAPIMIGNDGYSDVAFGGIIDEVRISNIARMEFNTQPANQTNQTDTTPPIITITNPQNGSAITTNSTTLQVTTNENAICKYVVGYVQNCYQNYGSTATVCVGAGWNGGSMTVTGGISHSQILSNLINNSTYTVNVNCTDSSNNSNTSSVTFFVNITTTTSSCGCGCTGWVNTGCEISPCSSNQMKQVRNCSCSPIGCVNMSEYQCVSDSSCIKTSNNCTDTDDSLGGSQGYMGYGVKGTVTIDGTSYTDYCENPTTLHEYYCALVSSSSGKYYIVDRSLPTCNCVDGTCVPTPSTGGVGGGGGSTIPTNQTCPICSSTSAWSNCINSNQTRIRYICGASTNYQCQAYTETRSCIPSNQTENQTCPVCPSASAWSNCANNMQTRTNYKCDTATNYQCQSYNETQACTSPPTVNITCSIDTDCINKGLSCHDNETLKCINNTCQCSINPVDKTVLLGILIQMETMKTSFASLNSSATALLDYYTSINDVPNSEKWTNVTVLFDDAIGNINDIKTYINTVKDAPTQADITIIKNKIGNVLSIVDKIVEAILNG